MICSVVVYFYGGDYASSRASGASLLSRVSGFSGAGGCATSRVRGGR
jgi:hypothetical protein